MAFQGRGGGGLWRGEGGNRRPKEGERGGLGHKVTMAGTLQNHCRNSHSALSHIRRLVATDGTATKGQQDGEGAAAIL